MSALAAEGFEFVSGLEVEFHLTKLIDPRLSLEDSGQPGSPPSVSLLHQGYAYLTEQRFDTIEPVLDILRRDCLSLGLPLHSMELEFGPSQCEFVFRPGKGIGPADDMIVFRNAVKQISRRQGYHATFMCRPQFPNAMSSGWHLHQSLVHRDTGQNAFANPAEGRGLSAVGRQFLAGLLAGAGGATPFTTPTINGYKRYRANSLAPDRIAWGEDNRGAMLRVLARGPAAATRIENRVGEPAANPYLYLASQVITGLSGIVQQRSPPPSVDMPYEAKAEPLPTSLEAALRLLDESRLMRDGFGDAFVDYFLMVKRAEVARYNSTVTDWEQREYFDLF
jgi:glutamine synthetase